MKDLEVGQVISLRIRMGFCGVFKDKHPYLILAIRESDNVIEIGQLHSMEGKLFEIISETNKAIYQGFPDETVIDQDSFIQLDNTILIEYFDELSDYRRQKDKLSSNKLQKVINAYETYHKKHHIAEDHTIYLNRQDIEKLNN